MCPSTNPHPNIRLAKEQSQDDLDTPHLRWLRMPSRRATSAGPPQCRMACTRSLRPARSISCWLGSRSRVGTLPGPGLGPSAAPAPAAWPLASHCTHGGCRSLGSLLGSRLGLPAAAAPAAGLSGADPAPLAAAAASSGAAAASGTKSAPALAVGDGVRAAAKPSSSRRRLPRSSQYPFSRRGRVPCSLQPS